MSGVSQSIIYTKEVQQWYVSYIHVPGESGEIRYPWQFKK